jgi:hypothetical protein
VAAVTALLLHVRAWVTVRAALACLGPSPARQLRLASATRRGLALGAGCALALLAGRESARALAGSLQGLPPAAIAGLSLAGGGAAALACAGALLLWRPALLGPQALALLRRAGLAGGRP